MGEKRGKDDQSEEDIEIINEIKQSKTNHDNEKDVESKIIESTSIEIQETKEFEAKGLDISDTSAGVEKRQEKDDKEEAQETSPEIEDFKETSISKDLSSSETVDAQPVENADGFEIEESKEKEEKVETEQPKHDIEITDDKVKSKIYDSHGEQDNDIQFDDPKEDFNEKEESYKEEKLGIQKAENDISSKDHTESDQEDQPPNAALRGEQSEKNDIDMVVPEGVKKEKMNLAAEELEEIFPKDYKDSEDVVDEESHQREEID